MKIKKKILIIILPIYFLVISCGTIEEAWKVLRNEKIKSTDEFLVEKKEPLTTPPEIFELPLHPWFIGVQFHPELKSRPFSPHPLFSSFVNAVLLVFNRFSNFFK